jgi:RNA polymerase sigma-70 factor (ECF subfamily)
MINPMNNYETAAQTLSSSHLESLIKGNRKAQHKLYEIFAPRMLSLCLRYTSSKEEAEDLVQEGFIKVFRYLHQYTGQGNFEGWMRRIFINTAIEYLRKRIFVERLGDSDSHEIKVNGSSGYDSLAHADLVKIIQSLSEGYRTIFNLYVVEGFSHREIADILNITESTSKSQLSRAKVILQKSLSKIGIAA